MGNDVRRGALDGHVDGHAFAGVAQRRIARRQFRDPATSTQKRLHVALLLCHILDVDHVPGDAVVGAEIGIDEVARFIARDAGPSGQAEVAHAIGQAEVDHLGHGTLIRGDLVSLLLQHPGGSLAVDVGASLEGLLEVDVAGHVRQDTKLDLAVVRGEQDQVFATSHEGAADLPSQRCADGDVLEIGFDRREPAGRRHGLLEGRVQPGCPLVQQRGQRVHIGRLELGVGAPVQQHRDHGVGLAQVLQDLRAGGIAGLGALALGQVQLIEEHLLELLGAAQVELVADGSPDVLLQPFDGLAEGGREGIE